MEPDDQDPTTQAGDEEGRQPGVTPTEVPDADTTSSTGEDVAVAEPTDDPTTPAAEQDVQPSPAEDVPTPSEWFDEETPPATPPVDLPTTSDRPDDVPAAQLDDAAAEPPDDVPPAEQDLAVATSQQEEAKAITDRPDDLTATAQREDEVPASQPAPIDLPWPSAAETPAASTEAAAWSMGADRSGSSGWGALWRQSAQGWVEDPAGRAVWRPIVTTSASLSEWEVDTYLGLVTGELAISADNLEGSLRSARQDAVDRMVDDALARGAHAVIGVSVDLVEVARRVVVSAAGTAVTLKTSE